MSKSSTRQVELQQINEYETFTDVGHHTKAKIPNGYKKMRSHFVFDVKHDGGHKARLVADGHLTEVPLEYVYSVGVSLRGLFSSLRSRIKQRIAKCQRKITHMVNQAKLKYFNNSKFKNGYEIPQTYEQAM
jgi:hypothetical protein